MSSIYFQRFLKTTVRFFATKAHQKFERLVKQQRGSLVKMKINRHNLDPIVTPEVSQLAELFAKYGFEIRIAGGAVRDLLQGKTPEDVDFATNALPEEMKDMFEKENIRMINAKGEKHGTVTARLNDKENFEVTTLRIDVKTDGRHAEVEFTKDWALDAGRRDLTINSMFLELDGTLHDYFNGREDLEQHRVRFVGRAADRIQEDYLRILRYFRFYSKIAQEPNKHCEETLQAIRDNASGLAKISGERIWTEIRKFVVGPFAPHLIELMFDLGLGPHIGFPQNASSRTGIVAQVYERSIRFNPEPVTIVSALLGNDEDALTLNKRLKLSNDELGTIISLIRYRDEVDENDPFQWYQRLITTLVYIDPRCREDQARRRCNELAKYCGNGDLCKALDSWNIPQFPIEGQDLMVIGVPRGKKFGIILNELKQKWVESDFQKSKSELLDIASYLTKQS